MCSYEGFHNVNLKLCLTKKKPREYGPRCCFQIKCMQYGDILRTSHYNKRLYIVNITIRLIRFVYTCRSDRYAIYHTNNYWLCTIMKCVHISFFRHIFAHDCLVQNNTMYLSFHICCTGEYSFININSVDYILFQIQGQRGRHRWKRPHEVTTVSRH